MAEERGHGEDDIEEVVGIVWEMGVGRRASSGYGARKIDDDEIGDEFQGCSQEERPA